MIEARGLIKRFGRLTAVDAVNLDIGADQVVGFLGHNGAGKTTTLRMIAGYLTPTAGCVHVNGVDVVHDPVRARAQIGYLPESVPLYTEMRVREYLRFRAKLYGLNRAARAAAIDLAVQRCRLEDVMDRPIHQLSKGYRQRVGLAATLLHDPPVLILDEPTIGLDPAQILDIRQLIRDLGAHHTVVLSTHILPEVEAICDRVVMIARGRIRADGTMHELIEQMSPTAQYVVETNHPQAERLVGTVPGVRAVQAQGGEAGWQRLEVRGEAGTGDLREAIATALRNDEGWLVRDLERCRPSLEQMFIEMQSSSMDDDSQKHSASPTHEPKPALEGVA